MRKNKKDIEEIPKALRMDNTEKKKKKNVKKVLLVLVILAIIGLRTGGYLL